MQESSTCMDISDNIINKISRLLDGDGFNSRILRIEELSTNNSDIHLYKKEQSNFKDSCNVQINSSETHMEGFDNKACVVSPSYEFDERNQLCTVKVLDVSTKKDLVKEVEANRNNIKDKSKEQKTD